MNASVFRTSLLSLGLVGLMSLTSGCAKTAASGAAPANPVTTVTAIAAGIKAVGTGMSGARFSESAHARMSSSDCDSHGYPVVNQNDGKYPGHLTYCFTTIDQGDTVLGGFSTPTAISCIMTQAGVTYDNVPHTVTVTSAMLAACGFSSSDLPAGTTFNLTGSSPASFNTNFANGIVVDLSASLGLTFKMAMNVSGTKTSFLTNESWTDLSTGSTSGALDSATGDLWYESRVERLDCLASGRCGWARHTRIRAALTMSASGTPTGLNSLTFAYSNVQAPPGQGGYGGLLITASGDMTSGIKGRMWNATNGAAGQPTGLADYNTVGNWTETTNTKCFTRTTDSATTCGTGLDKFSTSTKFALNKTDSHLSVTAWLAAITGQTFATVNVDSDTQY